MGPLTVRMPPPRVSPNSFHLLSLDSFWRRNLNILMELSPTEKSQWLLLLADQRFLQRLLYLMRSLRNVTKLLLEAEWFSPSLRHRATESEPLLLKTTLLRPRKRSWKRPRSLERRSFFQVILLSPMPLTRMRTPKLYLLK